MLCVQGTPWKQPITYPTLLVCILNQLGCVLPATHGSARSNTKDLSHLVEGQHITAPCHSPGFVGLSSGKRYATSAYCVSATTAALRAVPASPTSGSLPFNHCRFFISTCHPSAPQITDPLISDYSSLCLFGLLLYIHKCAYLYYLHTFTITEISICKYMF